MYKRKNKYKPTTKMNTNTTTNTNQLPENTISEETFIQGENKTNNKFRLIRY